MKRGDANEGRRKRGESFREEKAAQWHQQNLTRHVVILNFTPVILQYLINI